MSWTDQKKYAAQDSILDFVTMTIGDDKHLVQIDQVWLTEDKSTYRLTLGTLWGSQSILCDSLHGLLVVLNAMGNLSAKELPFEIEKYVAKLGYKMTIEERPEVKV